MPVGTVAKAICPRNASLGRAGNSSKTEISDDDEDDDEEDEAETRKTRTESQEKEAAWRLLRRCCHFRAQHCPLQGEGF